MTIIKVLAERVLLLPHGPRREEKIKCTSENDEGDTYYKVYPRPRCRRARSDADKCDLYFKALGVACTPPPSSFRANYKTATPPPLQGEEFPPLKDPHHPLRLHNKYARYRKSSSPRTFYTPLDTAKNFKHLNETLLSIYAPPYTPIQTQSI